ncbi:hypothetical protein [Ruminococcus sp.]|uniref:hypothetical protein n=1 Tax=Ruminococcus sp. TaxID=41978 RepID=UPI0025D65408|nr:hypothetical protein [Ruminococcus sp.]MBQ8966243.1 hypothetical protein [Ruminococcus sp.]
MARCYRHIQKKICELKYIIARMDKPAKELELSELIRDHQAETEQTYGCRRVAIRLERRCVHHDPKDHSACDEQVQSADG